MQSLTLNRNRGAGKIRNGQFHRLGRALTEFAPHCVFIPGWSSGCSLAALAWCLSHQVPAVLMSESTEQDAPRSAWKEWLKVRVIALCATALVGGAPHLDYVAKLGMDRDRIFEGYDAVDNDYFRRTSMMVRRRSAALRTQFELPKSYFLSSARFIEKKNLSRLLEAYKGYCRAFMSHATGATENQPWSLVLLGNGPQKTALEQQVSREGLGRFVLLPGFKQYSQLPIYYGLASAFVHASTSEPWGLVVNEAMAAGLPVLVSNRCGCASDLVCEDRNGFTFDPWAVSELTNLMLKISNSASKRLTMGRASDELISNWGLRRFSHAVLAAAARAIEVGTPTKAAWPGALLGALTRQ